MSNNKAYCIDTIIQLYRWYSYSNLIPRLEYIMLLKFPIILSGISFYFNLLFPKLFLTKTILLPSICVFTNKTTISYTFEA